MILSTEQYQNTSINLLSPKYLGGVDFLYLGDSRLSAKYNGRRQSVGAPPTRRSFQFPDIMRLCVFVTRPVQNIWKLPPSHTNRHLWREKYTRILKDKCYIAKWIIWVQIICVRIFCVRYLKQQVEWRGSSQG